MNSSIALRSFFRSSPLFAAVAATAVCAGVARAETVDTISKSFPAAPGGRLAVQVDDGGIDVRASDTQQVAVEVVRKVRSSSKEAEEEILKNYEITIEQNGDTVTVRSHRKKDLSSWWRSFRTSTDFRFNVTVPTRFNTDLKTSGGGITVAGITGDVKAKTSGGGLKFSDITGPIDGDTSGGGITLSSCKGDVKVHTSGGGIDASSGEGPLNLDTSGGGITVKAHRGNVVAHTSGGGITTDQIVGTVEADTSGGSIRATLAAQPNGDCRLSTSGGGITVRMPANVALELDASTSAGSVDSEFAVAGASEKKSSHMRGTINGGGHLLHLRSSAGSIHLEKLPAAGPEA